MRRILITGGAGFVGYHLTKRLAADADNTITILDNFVRGKQDQELDLLLELPNVKLVVGDLTDLQTFASLSENYHEVYHLAAIIGVRNVLERPHEVLRTNALSTIQLLEWFVNGGGQKILFSSTSEAYAWTQQFYELPIPTPEDVPLALTDLENPRITYAASKIYGELIVRQYCKKFDQLFTIVRYHNVYGPRMGNEHVIPELYQRLLTGQNPLVVYSGSHRRAFCYIDDAVSMTIAAMRNEAGNGQTINIGNEEEISILELAMRLQKLSGITAEIVTEEALNDPVSRRCPDVSRARTLLGYDKWVSLDEGLAHTLAWYGQRLQGAINWQKSKRV